MEHYAIYLFPYISRLNQEPIVGQEAIKNADYCCAQLFVVCVGIPIVLLAEKISLNR
jgi:hypothetical protein